MGNVHSYLNAFVVKNFQAVKLLFGIELNFFWLYRTAYFTNIITYLNENPR